MKTYDTAEYAGSRLNETIIRLDGVPVMVLNCSESFDGILVKYEDIMTAKTGKALLSKFDLNPVPLGYVNNEGNAHYVTRMPLRNDWKQGIRQRSICDCNGFGVGHIPYTNIGHTIMGKFPTMKATLESLSAYCKSMAFSREFAAQRDGSLVYKSLFTVGKINMDNGAVAIDPAYSWVKESFDELMEKAA